MPLRRWWWIPLVLLSPVFAESERHEDPKGVISIPLPASWKVTRVPQRNELAILSLDAQMDADSPVLMVTVYHFQTGQPSELGQARVDAPVLDTYYESGSLDVLIDPRPHCLVRYKTDGQRRFRLVAYRIVKRTAFSISFKGPLELLDTVRPHLFAAADGFVSELPSSPEYPATYKRSLDDGLEFVVHERFPKSELKRTKRLFRDIRKAYEKRVGKVPERPEYPVQVVLHASRADARIIHEPGGKRDYLPDLAAMRVFAVPVHGENAQAESELAHAFVTVLHAQRFGTCLGDFVRAGEATLSWVMVQTGKDLPAITEGLQGKFNLPPVTLVDLPEVGLGKMGNYAPMYLLLFHAGPSRYRRAYRAFLHAFDFGGDWEMAWRDHILPLDGDRFRRDLARFLEREVKVVKRRR